MLQQDWYKILPWDMMALSEECTVHLGLSCAICIWVVATCRRFETLKINFFPVIVNLLLFVNWTPHYKHVRLKCVASRVLNICIRCKCGVAFRLYFWTASTSVWKEGWIVPRSGLLCPCNNPLLVVQDTIMLTVTGPASKSLIHILLWILPFRHP